MSLGALCAPLSRLFSDFREGMSVERGPLSRPASLVRASPVYSTSLVMWMHRGSPDPALNRRRGGIGQRVLRASVGRRTLRCE
jgi:hypothetical protein